MNKMINGIGLQNFRSYVDKTFINLKPITVFVGKNSSGKSSLLRTFPLLRQSVEENTTGPILWYGRFVDFGDFTDVLSRNSENKEITFSFSLSSRRKFRKDTLIIDLMILPNGYKY
jgi:AAA15 family ATPase/GTPase